MIGGGIFSLPQNMAARADVGAVLIGWAITAVGMLTLAFVFQTLANRKPRSEEHTSELQSLMRNSYAVFCLKKKKKQIPNSTIVGTCTRIKQSARLYISD